MRHMSGENALPLTLLVKQDSQRIATSTTRHSCIPDCVTSSSAGMSTSVRFLLTDPKMTTPPLKRYTLRGVVLVTITQSLKKGEKTALLHKKLTANCSRSIYSELKHLYNLAVHLLPACIYDRQSGVVADTQCCSTHHSLVRVKTQSDFAMRCFVFAVTHTTLSCICFTL